MQFQQQKKRIKQKNRVRFEGTKYGKKILQKIQELDMYEFIEMKKDQDSWRIEIQILKYTVNGLRIRLLKQMENCGQRISKQMKDLKKEKEDYQHRL
ncbi:unnamed protein product [Paramecium sonneborni]|uniref:Uncharacterized protein n=1 Tax=Paramecium sonneborni TaxID=65129 RepID=A0A8S1PAW7_9CILI|nr:unnamed protein product [Paramecium sonneborni]